MPDYFTLAEARDLPDMAQFNDARIEAAAAGVVSIIEREVGTSFVARTVTDEIHDGGCGAIVLGASYVISVTGASVSGSAVVGTLTAQHGILRMPSGTTTFATGNGNVQVTYQAGYSTEPPADIKEAALKATRWKLLESKSNSDVSARQTSMTTDMGGTVNYAVAGPDRPTGYPDVDAVIVGWRDAIRLPSFA